MKQSCSLYRKTVNFLLLFVSLTLSTATILRAEGSLFTEVDPQTLTLNATQQSIVNYFSNLPSMVRERICLRQLGIIE